MWARRRGEIYAFCAAACSSAITCARALFTSFSATISAIERSNFRLPLNDFLSQIVNTVRPFGKVEHDFLLSGLMRQECFTKTALCFGRIVAKHHEPHGVLDFFD